MYNKICGMPKLADIADCRLIYVKSSGKGVGRAWLASFTSLCVYTVRTPDYLQVQCAAFGNLEIHEATKLIYTLPWGRGKQNQGSQNFPFLQETEEILTFLYTSMLGDSSATPLLVCP